VARRTRSDCPSHTCRCLRRSGRIFEGCRDGGGSTEISDGAAKFFASRNVTERDRTLSREQAASRNAEAAVNDAVVMVTKVAAPRNFGVSGYAKSDRDRTPPKDRILCEPLDWGYPNQIRLI